MATRETEESEAPRPYHHGDLKAAMLKAAEAILERDGVQGLTLRGAAREAGASHAAPKNHFGDLTGLLSELAAVGYERFTEAMRAAASAETTADGRLNAIGRAYVEFAAANPGLFQLMFRSERLDPARPALGAAMSAAFGVLAGSVAAVRGDAPAQGQPSQLDLSTAGSVVRAWAMVHGFAMLLIDGRIDPILSRLPEGTSVGALLAEMLGPAGR